MADHGAGSGAKAGVVGFAEAVFGFKLVTAPTCWIGAVGGGQDVAHVAVPGHHWFVGVGAAGVWEGELVAPVSEG